MTKRKPSKRSKRTVKKRPRPNRVVGHIALDPFQVRPYDQTFGINERGHVLRIRGVRRAEPNYELLAEAFLSIAARINAEQPGRGPPPVEPHPRDLRQRRRPRPVDLAKDKETQAKLEELKRQHQQDIQRLLEEDEASS